MKCPACGGENQDGHKFCIHCGASLERYVFHDTKDSYKKGGGQLPPSMNTTRIKRRRINLTMILSMIGLFTICLSVAVFLVMYFQPSWLPFSVLTPLMGGDRIILGFPNLQGEIDIHELVLGKEASLETLIAEDIVVARGGLWTLEDNQYQRIGSDNFLYGGFLPGAGDFIFWHLEDDDIVLEKFTGRRELSTIFDTNSSYPYALIFNRGQNIFLGEQRDDTMRCYVSISGEEAERLGKGDSCFITLDGSKVFISEESADGLTLTASDIDGSNEVVLLDEEEGISNSDVSYDGSHVAFMRDEGDLVQIALINLKNGKMISEEEDAIGIVQYDFSWDGKTFFYILENEDNEHCLYTLSDEASTLIYEDYKINASSSPKGNQIIFVAGDIDEEKTIYAYSISSKDVVEVLSGEGLSYLVLDSPERILIKQQVEDELTIYSADIDGDNLIRLYSEDSIYLNNAFYVVGEKLLYLFLRDDEGLQSLYITTIDQEDGNLVVEEWVELNLLARSPNGKLVVFAGREEYRDDLALYSIALDEGARSVTLDDDADGFVNVVFTNNSAEVIYTAIYGEDPNDVEVRMVRADGEERYRVIHEEAYIVDVRWDRIGPFDMLHWWGYR